MTSHKPPVPPPPVRFPTRTAAAHVQTAVAQAKLPSAPAPRGAAPHVQAAVAQARPAPSPPTRGAAPHVQAAAKVPPPHRPPAAPLPSPVRAPQAAHVQRAVTTVQPKASQPVRPAGATPRHLPAPHVRQRAAQTRPLTVQLAKQDHDRPEREEEDERVPKKFKAKHEKSTLTVDRFFDFSTFGFGSSLPPPPTSSFSFLPPPTSTFTFLPPPPTSVSSVPHPLLSLPPMLTIPSFSTSDLAFLLSRPSVPFPTTTPSTPLVSPSTTLATPSSSPSSSVVTVYDPTTPELSDLAQSAQDLFAYKGSEAYTDQRIVKLYNVSGLTFDKRSKASVHAAVQIDHLTPMIVKSGEYGTPTEVVRTWMGNLTWKNKTGETRTGFTSPSIGDREISFTIPRKISKKTGEPGHRWSAHAEVNAYRELYKLYTEDQGTPSAITKFRMATNIAHCAECWWAAYALFKRLGIDVGKLETSSPTENVLFNQWTEPWDNFYKDLGMDASPFRDKKGKLKSGFKKNKKADPVELNKLQRDVRFI